MQILAAELKKQMENIIVSWKWTTKGLYESDFNF